MLERGYPSTTVPITACLSLHTVVYTPELTEEVETMKTYILGSNVFNPGYGHYLGYLLRKKFVCGILSGVITYDYDLNRNWKCLASEYVFTTECISTVSTPTRYQPRYSKIFYPELTGNKLCN